MKGYVTFTSGISCDSIEILIKDDDNNILFRKSYGYGYSICGYRGWTDHPFAGDLVEEKLAKFGLSKEDAEYAAHYVFKDVWERDPEEVKKIIFVPSH